MLVKVWTRWIIHSFLLLRKNDTDILENNWKFLIKLYIQLLFDTEIIILGIYAKEMKT